MATLFEEIEIGSLKARNRLFRSATAESLGTKEGIPSRYLATLYSGLAEGEIGTIITGYCYVRPDGKPSERSLSLADDNGEAEFRALVEAAHSDGACIIAQLVYGGSKSKLTPDDPRRIAVTDTDSPTTSILGPSAIQNPATGLIPTPASSDDIRSIVDSFADAAARAKRFGFDGVEIHAAHGYLLSQFLDPRFNKRDDTYGMTLEGRARITVECIRSVRHAVGPDFPIFVKLNSCDVYGDTLAEQGGLSEAESIQAAGMFERAGASAIDVSGDWHAVDAKQIDGEPFFGSYGSRLASKLSIPVIVTGGWRDYDIIERYLESTGIAGIGMARPLILEPFLAARWSAGDRRPCVCNSCNFCTKQAGIPCIQRNHR